MHRLYGYRGSGSAAVEAALVLAGLPHRIVEAASWDDRSALDELARLNPLRQIPTLVLPDGSVMTESVAILIHLGLEHAGSGLLPEGAAARAQALRGLVFIAANCYAAISVSDYPERWVASRGAATQAKVRQAARARLHEHWELFADTFANDAAHTFFPRGAAPRALELLAAVVSKWSGTRQHLASSRPGFLARLKAIEQHPSVSAVFQRHWPG